MLWRYRQPKQINKQQLLASTLVAYASQTGTAKALAIKQQQILGGSKVVALMALSDLRPAQLIKFQKVVFVVSTYGDGEPPDNGRCFYQDLQALTKPKRVKSLGDNNIHSTMLSGVNYEVLALGDSRYPKFCQFADDLNSELTKLGAKLSSPVQKQDQFQPASTKQDVQLWQLNARVKLTNEQDTGLFHLRLSSKQKDLQWQAGDVVAIYPYNDLTAHPRRYSVASVPNDGEMSLIVRKHQDDTGTSGFCSDWLTSKLTVDDPIILQVEQNKLCHINDSQVPLLLIGAGSGLAGIRGHLAERSHQINPGDTWLIYGERQADSTQPLYEEFKHWQQTGVLTQLDCAFSRDPANPSYVQDVLTDKWQQIAHFISENAYIYVCGRHNGMGSAVDSLLRSTLGADGYQKLLAQGRYLRDLY
ncbi:NADPH cytochrome P450 oxidoreductase family protein [Rheinheimera sp. MMS21-TC3]|uniref:NADPH cytochrome P450 oxidoreductase family protein n=1 Tax=Rheinheimera sp. MMS21-TC3 TaxID=3072790 RepID=UPI0028C4DD87|nr:NADPH cytochrome P450 oxidoreductase family protein [Rheinheimera sp. MMS21-TC3]WNO61982.1 NADPH cytochrome P450 oxidoreductase family protein [Rheinheimera sp. MMS21-TC3]